MNYSESDIDMTIMLGGYPDDKVISSQLIHDALIKTEVFHHLFACKLLDKIIGKAEFDFDLTGIDEKLNKIVEQLSVKNLEIVIYKSKVVVNENGKEYTYTIFPEVSDGVGMSIKILPDRKLITVEK